MFNHSPRWSNIHRYLPYFLIRFFSPRFGFFNPYLRAGTSDPRAQETEFHFGLGEMGGGILCPLLLILFFDFSLESAWVWLIIAAMQTELLRISLASKLVSSSSGDKYVRGNLWPHSYGLRSEVN